MISRSSCGSNARTCLSGAVGAAASLGPVIDVSDAAILAMAAVNIIGLYAQMPTPKREMNGYLARLASGEIRKFR